LVRVAVSSLAAVPVPPPVKPEPVGGADHVYVVPDGISPGGIEAAVAVGAYENAKPLHALVLVCELIMGAGFITTVTVKVLPVQLPVVGVTL
jgi:hypothetical protein